MAKRGQGADRLTLRFIGDRLRVEYGTSAAGGRGIVRVDGRRVGTLSFRGTSHAVAFGDRRHTTFDGLSGGRHRAVIVARGAAYLDTFRF